ncbi:MAG: hypothetical protein LBV17_00790 [Treponema sp.]|nr:hypothetical protein [Treponema sp.]
MVCNRGKTVSPDWFIFGTSFTIMVSTILRNGEVMAIHYSQLTLTDGVNIVPMIAGRQKIRRTAKADEA